MIVSERSLLIDCIIIALTHYYIHSFIHSKHQETRYRVKILSAVFILAQFAGFIVRSREASDFYVFTYLVFRICYLVFKSGMRFDLLLNCKILLT